ncbi:MAG: homoserine kinase [Solirubrobacterales bacterium]
MEAVTARRRLVRVPASSANLGPGYDVLAAALGLHLELDVSEADEFSVRADVDVAGDRSNLCVRAFELLHSADGLAFEIRSEIPLRRGLGSSAAAIVAGLVAADHLFELGLSASDIYARAVELEGHPDNVGAALYGGVVVCPTPEAGAQPAPFKLDPPQGVEAVLVIPDDEVATTDARAAMPPVISVEDAVANVAAATQLVLGIERSDLGLIARGLADRLHQPSRRALYERSLDLVDRARELGAIGGTISGAGPSVLLWSYWQDTGKVVEAATAASHGWAEIRRLAFTPQGADVPEL